MDEPQIISEGYEYIIEDLLDDRVVARYSDWDCSDPANRSWKHYMSYPREARLYKRKIVKYDLELIAQPARLSGGDQDEKEDGNGPNGNHIHQL